MSTKSEKKKSYFAPSALAVKFAKAMESAGATPEEINGMSEDKEFLQNMLENYRDFDPHQFFVTRPALWVSSDFCDMILSVAKKTAKVSLSVTGYFDLPTPMNDAEIQKQLRERHIYNDASKFCSILAGMIVRQPSGEDGDLITNGKANLFYVRGKDNEVFVAVVYWDFDIRAWRVRADRLRVSLQCHAGCRAFSPNSILAK